MPHKDKAIRNAYNREWYARNKNNMKHGLAASRAKYRKSMTALVQKHKDKPCVDCGVKYPYYVMDFDHVRGEKLFCVSNRQHGMNKETLLEEINKCDVVCSNCHRERTYKRRSHIT